MKRKPFVTTLTIILFFFATCFCTVAWGKKKESANVNSNKQSLETSTRGKERAEQRHQVKEKMEVGKTDDDSENGDDDEDNDEFGEPREFATKIAIKKIAEDVVNNILTAW